MRVNDGCGGPGCGAGAGAEISEPPHPHPSPPCAALFTRPGVEMFLDMFKDEVEAIDEDPPIKFKWK